MMHAPVAADVSAIHSVASLTQMCVYSSGPGRCAATCVAHIVKQSDKHVEYNYPLIIVTLHLGCLCKHIKGEDS